MAGISTSTPEEVMGDTKFPAHHIRIRACLIAAVTASIALAACSSSTSTGTSQAANSKSGTKLILFELAFPCGLNSGISELCSSVTAQAAKLPSGYKVEIKNAVD